MTIYAIGDIHGCYYTMMDLLDVIKEDVARSNNADPVKLVFLGDYVDRGNYSAWVVDYLISLSKSCKLGDHEIEPIFLMGNHEDMLLNDFMLHQMNGGQKTFASYEDNGIDINTHIDFYKGLDLYHRDGEFVFVHAGLSPEKTPEQLYKDELLWERQWNAYDGEFKDNVYVVHGHTPIKEVKFLLNQVNIDTGAVFGNKLTAIRFDDRDEFTIFQKDVDKRDIT